MQAAHDARMRRQDVPDAQAAHDARMADRMYQTCRPHASVTV